MADRNTNDSGRASPRKYPPELKQRAIRMVLDSYDRGEERFGAVTRIARRYVRPPSRFAASRHQRLW